MMIPIFQNFFEVLKNASACRKDFFDTLNQSRRQAGLVFYAMNGGSAFYSP